MATRLKLQYLGVEWKAREERNGVEIGGKRATGAEDTKEAKVCAKEGGTWTQQEARDDEGGEQSLEYSGGSSKSKIEKETKRKRERDGRENCWRVPWNAVGSKEDRRKQAAIVSDDSLVATHVSPLLPLLAITTPFSCSFLRAPMTV